MKLSEWTQVAALLVFATAAAWALGATVASSYPMFAWPAGLVMFAALLFAVALLVEWKSGGRL